eukprot:2015780-Alexandrium_andersonii.AAC.1
MGAAHTCLVHAQITQRGKHEHVFWVIPSAGNMVTGHIPTLCPAFLSVCCPAVCEAALNEFPRG